MRDDFCVLILSHDRAGNIPTIESLERSGYTGDWYIVVDHPDDEESYKSEYGEDKVIYFDKDETQPELDRGDNFNRRNSILYARYYSFQIARDLGYTYFMQLDDDYTRFEWRFDENYEYIKSTPEVTILDDYIENAIEFMDNTQLDTICMAQGGDYIGGSESTLAQKVQTKRKAMNSFICRADNQFDFRGSINEDVNTYTRAQQYGKLFLTVNFLSLKQERTQQEEGGLTDLYEAEGTYIKSFYTALYTPSAMSLQKLSDGADERIHHQINWRKCVPKIVPESCKN